MALFIASLYLGITLAMFNYKPFLANVPSYLRFQPMVFPIQVINVREIVTLALVWNIIDALTMFVAPVLLVLCIARGVNASINAFKRFITWVIVVALAMSIPLALTVLPMYVYGSEFRNFVISHPYIASLSDNLSYVVKYIVIPFLATTLAYSYVTNSRFTQSVKCFWIWGLISIIIVNIIRIFIPLLVILLIVNITHNPTTMFVYLRGWNPKILKAINAYFEGRISNITLPPIPTWGHIASTIVCIAVITLISIKVLKNLY